MKKFIYSFLLIIVSFFVLSSCNNNKNEVEDDSKYQVTKEEFEKANSFENENYKTVVDYTKIVNGIAEKSNYYYEVRDGYGRQKIDGEWGIIQKIDKFSIARANNMVFINDYYEQFNYDENIKSYVADAVKLYDYSSYRIICKYENKRLIHVEVYITYNDNDNQDNSIINYEYDVVEPFEDIPYVVTEEEFNSALDFTKMDNFRRTIRNIDGSLDKIQEWCGLWERTTYDGIDWQYHKYDEKIDLASEYNEYWYYFNFNQETKFYDCSVKIRNANVSLKFHNKKLVQINIKLDNINQLAYIEYDITPFEHN